MLFYFHNIKKKHYSLYYEGFVKDVRLLTKKDTGQSRGCAYVEFEDKITHMVGTYLY